MKNLKSTRSRAMSLAHKMKEGKYPNGKEIKKAFKVIRVKDAMKETKVKFSFYQLAKETSPVTGLIITDRTGTTNLDLIPVEFHPKKRAVGAKTRKSNPLQVRYFDFMRNGWRSFKADRYCAAIL